MYFAALIIVVNMSPETTLKIIEYFKPEFDRVKRQESRKEKAYSQFQDESIDQENDINKGNNANDSGKKSFDYQDEEQFKANYD